MDAKLKIGFVLDDSLDKADGVQQYILTIGAWLTAQGHDVHYLVGQTKRDDIANIHSLGKNIAVRFNRNRMSIPLPTSRAAIHALLQREQFDVLHVQLPYSPWLAQRIIHAAGPQTVIFGTFHIVPHSFTVRTASRVLSLWTHSSLRRFDQIVSVSTAAEKFARRTFKLKSDIVPNAVEYSRFSRAKPFGQYKDKLEVVFLGRLVPRKGCLQLLEAVDFMLKNPRGIPAFRVIVCGKGPLEAKLKAYSREHHLESCVEFIGFVAEEDKPRYLASADVAVFPSTGGESFGIVLIEAMAAGRAAVLAGDNVGYRSVMSEKSELLFPPHNIEILASKLSGILQDDAARKDAAAWGKDHAKQFDVQVVGSNLVERYKRALHSRRNVR